MNRLNEYPICPNRTHVSGYFSQRSSGLASSNPKREQTLLEIRNFQSSFHTLVMATVGADGIPEASYAPFIHDEHKHFYIYISELAKHTQNLKEAMRVSVLFIEDEGNTKNLFARRRLTYNCTAQLIERGSERWSVILQGFRDRLGEFVDRIKPLEDFRMFRLLPYQGHYVKGFGYIYHISGSDLNQIQQVKPDSPMQAVDNHE